MKLGIFAFPLTRSLETGRGLEKVLVELCSELEKSNRSFSLYDSGFIRSEVEAILKAIPFLTRLRKTADDVYLGIYPVAAIFPILLNKRPVITAVFDMIPYSVRGYDSFLKFAIKRWCIRYACKNSDYLIVDFATNKEKIIQLFGIPEDRIALLSHLSHGVNHRLYYPEAGYRKDFNIAFLGEAKRSKGMDSVIKAFKLIHAKQPQATLTLASHGSELEQMKHLAKSLLAEPSYQFVGFVPEEKMRQFYNTADIFTFPSRYGMGLSSLEAMACGTPAIVGKDQDTRDFIDDPDVMVDPDNEQEIADKILRLFEDRDLYRQKVAQGLTIAQAYSWENMANKYYDLCQEVHRRFQAEKSHKQGV
jgi:glycosyltransferase involved in cell wall biosynthesis